MKELLTTLLQNLGLAWWVEIRTEKPRCTYYFGPFTSQAEAEEAKTGYLEDLKQEGAQGLGVTVKQCKPSILTDYEDDLGEMTSQQASAVLGQA